PWIPDGWLDPDDGADQLAGATGRFGGGDLGLTARRSGHLRRPFVSLPGTLLGPRPAMITLTYPGDWQRWVPTGRTLEAHRRAFERRWVRQWHQTLVGVWVKEFQISGRPHLHLY